MEQVKKEFDRFGRYLVQQSRSNLTRGGHRASNDLYQSLDYDLKVSRKGSVEFSFFMEDYGDFVDKGVKGSQEQKKAPKSPYKYTNKMPPASVFSKWTVKKGIAPRTKTGQFTTRKGVQFAIAKSIFLTGLKTTNFYSLPFERAFKRLPDEIVEAYGLDLDRFLESALNNAS